MHQYFMKRHIRVLLPLLRWRINNSKHARFETILASARSFEVAIRRKPGDVEKDFRHGLGIVRGYVLLYTTIKTPFGRIAFDLLPSIEQANPNESSCEYRLNTDLWLEVLVHTIPYSCCFFMFL